MWNFIRRWRHRRQTDTYPLFDGIKTRRIDPLRVYRELLAHPDYRRSDWAMLEVTEPELRLKAIGRLSQVFRDVFAVPSAEDGGLSDRECLQILQTFFGDSERQKKSTDRTQILHPYLEWLRCPRVTVNMSDDLGCGSISTDSVSPPEKPYIQVSAWRSTASMRVI